MPTGAAWHLGAPPPASMPPLRCLLLQRCKAPPAVPILRQARGSDARCGLTTVAAERPAGSSSDLRSEEAAQLRRAQNNGAESNGSDDLQRSRSSSAHISVSQAYAHRPAAHDAQHQDQQQQSESAAAAAQELSSVRHELSSVRELLMTQAHLSRQQSLELKQLQNMVAAQTQAVVQAAQPNPLRPLEAQLAALGDRRNMGMYDARFHSTHKGATPKDMRVLPRRIILVRHAESEGNISSLAYTFTPDPQVPLTERGWFQARAAGQRIKELMEADGKPYRLYFYTSPYKRSQQTYQAVRDSFSPQQIAGQQEEVQLREQDFGNFQDGEAKQKEKAERLRFGRFFYRFPHGESGADVYDRMTIFEDHMIRDINAGRYSRGTSLVLVTHGLALRVFLMRWFHWTVDQFLEVFNPPNAEPLVLERIPAAQRDESGHDNLPPWMHTKALYRLTDETRLILRGCSDEMCIAASDPLDRSHHGVDDPPY